MVLYKLMKRTGLLFFLLVAFFFRSASQTPVDSLLAEVKKTKADTNRVKLLNEIAYHSYIYDTTKSSSYQKEALKLAADLKYLKGVGYSKYLEGRHYAFTGKYLLAIEALTEAIEAGQKTGYFELIARAYNSIGLCNVHLNDEYNARNAFEQAMIAIDKSPNKDFKAGIIHNLGSLHYKNKNYNAALDSFFKSEAINVSAGNKLWLAQNYLEIGLAYEAMNYNKEAIAYANKAFSLAKEIKAEKPELKSLLILGKVYTKYGRFHIAKRYLDAGFKITVSKNLKGEQVAFDKAYSFYYERMGNYPQALFHEKRSATLHDSLFKSGRTNLILEYQEKFKSQQRDAENQLLKNERSNQVEKIRQKNQLLKLAVILCLFSIVCSIVIYFGNRRIKQSNRLLRIQKDEIQRQKENVEHLNHIKDKLFSVISHDLRSPFASLKSMMDLYDEGQISKEDVDFFFREIRKDIGTNSLLLDNLLIWSKSQLQGFKVNPHSFSLTRMFEEVSWFSSKKIISKKIDVQINIGPDHIVFADYEMTKAIARNLLANALKFTPRNGKITISASRQGSHIEVSVADNGTGISEDRKDLLLKENFVTSTGLDNEKGNGLGLQICREFVEKNGGQIWFESISGEGTTFYFSLPVGDESLAVQNGRSYDDIELEKRQLDESIRSKVKQQQKFDRYELLAKATDDTIYDWDTTSNEIRWNESLLSNFGYQEETTAFHWWSERIHPDDLPQVKEKIQAVISARGLNCTSEYRFLAADGTYKYVLDRGLLIYDEKGSAMRMIGIMQNAQAQRNAISEIQRLSLVAKNVNNLVVITDAEDKIVWVNKAFEKFTGFELSEISGRMPKDVLGGHETRPETLLEIDGYVADNQAFSTELINYKKSGEPYWVRIDCTPYNDPITNQVGYVAIQTIITERKINEQLLLKKNEALREIARISSHEVRSPLSSILGLVQLLKGNVDQHEFEECLNLLHISADQLDSLIYKIHNHIADIEEDQNA